MKLLSASIGVPRTSPTAPSIGSSPCRLVRHSKRTVPLGRAFHPIIHTALPHRRHSYGHPTTYPEAKRLFLHMKKIRCV
jgi:hypothetical protein